MSDNIAIVACITAVAFAFAAIIGSAIYFPNHAWKRVGIECVRSGGEWRPQWPGTTQFACMREVKR